MQFTLNSSLFLAACATVAEAQAGKSPLPILECILMKVTDGKLDLMCSDTENQLSTSIDIDAQTDTNISLAIEAKLLLEALRLIPEQPLTVTYTPDTKEVRLDYLGGHINFIGQEADDFPVIFNSSEELAKVVIDQQILFQGINSVYADINTEADSLRPQMQGVCIDRRDGNLNIAAASMSKVTKFSQIGYGTDFPQFTIPFRPANVLRKSIDPRNASLITVTITSSSLIFENINGNSTLNCRRLEGQFPNYQMFFKHDTPGRALIDRQSFLLAVRRSQICASTVSGMVQLRFEGDKLTIESRDLDYSLSSTNEMTIDYSGNPITFGISAKLLLEKLQLFKSESVIMYLTSEKAPVIIRPTEQLREGTELETLVMVMELQQY